MEVAAGIGNPDIVRLLLENGIATQQSSHARYFLPSIAKSDLRSEEDLVQITRMLLDYELVSPKQVRMFL